MQRNFSSLILWGVLSGALLAGTACWTFLSNQFIYGEGHAERPIVEFLVAYWVVWVVYAVASALALGCRQRSLRWILLVGLLARLSVLPSNLILENDVYRYVLDGQVLLSGNNPYRDAPSSLTENARGGLNESLQSPEARLTLSRIGYPQISTVYPPVAQGFFAIGSVIGGWHWQGQRVVFLAIDLALIFLLLSLFRKEGLPRHWVLIYAWNPLIIKEVVNSAHVDILVPLFLVILLWTLGRFLQDPRFRWVAIASISLGCAVLSKVYPLILLPAIMLWIFRRTRDWRQALGGLLLTMFTVLIGYLPFLDIGVDQLFRGLVVYAREWRMNEGAFAVINLVFGQPRMVVSVVVAVAAVAVPWIRKSTGIRALAEDLFWVLLLWFLLIPTPFPWYAVPLVLLGIISGRSATMVMVCLSGIISFYYLGFLYEYREFSAGWWKWTKVIEHSLLWLTAATALGLTFLSKREKA